MKNSLPPQAQKYFWGDNLKQLNWPDHKKYIIQTLLNKGDTESLSWLFDQTSPKQISKIIPQLKLDAKSENFWKLYLS